MTRILSADLLIADILAPVAGNAKVQALTEKYDMRPGAKRALSDAQVKEFHEALDGVPVVATPGGSSANMLTTLCKLLGRDIEVRFVGMAGDAKHCGIIRQSLQEAGITLVPERYPGGHVLMQSALSFVFVFPDGQCTIATHPGNAREILKPAMIAEHLVTNSEVVLVQGSLWHKFQPDFADRLIKLCGKDHHQLWLTLPTQASISLEEQGRFFNALSEATLIFGNDAELDRLYGLPLQESLQKLQKTFREKDRTGETARTLGFITLGKDGAAIVTASNIEFINPVKMEPRDIVNTLGAGDTSYAGFAAGFLKKLSDHDSAQLAMTLAAEKLRTNSSRLADPKAALASASPELTRKLRA